MPQAGGERLQSAHIFQAGEVVVADFGIALAVDSAGGTRITETGFSLGTPAYMSPEQVSGEQQIDGAADPTSSGVPVRAAQLGV